MKITAKNAARSAALVGIMAATLECAKLALASIPNVEIITLLIAVYSYTFGALGVVGALVFVLIEPLIWGFGSWFITYLIYWPTLAFIFMLLGRVKLKSRIALTGTALICTLFFGMISSLVDVGLFTGYFDRFFYRFGIYYARGIVFYAIQLATNAVLFPLLFIPMHKMLLRVSKI